MKQIKFRNLIIILITLCICSTNSVYSITTKKEEKKEQENMKTKAAFIYIAPQNDPKTHRAVINSPVIHLTVVGVVDYNQAESIAIELVSEGITAIELCAGFGNEGTARIAKCVGDKALVGVVRFDLHPAFGHKSGDSIF